MKKIHFSLLLICLSSFISCKPQVKENEPVVPATRPAAFEKKDTVKNQVAIPDIIHDEGENVLFYPNGQIKMKGPKKDGKRDGHWESWYPDGTVWSECDYKAGIKNGRNVTYYENGKKRYEGNFKNDEETGIWKYYQENGNLFKEVDYSKKK